MTVEAKVIPINLQVRPRESDKLVCQKRPSTMLDVRLGKRNRRARDAKPRLVSKQTQGSASNDTHKRRAYQRAMGHQ